ncbi:MAG: hypothetical protein LBG84_02020 [Treponema sp.]|jgi:hypothetical protein|nr:hypothetical protein [Treponema sp.]
MRNRFIIPALLLISAAALPAQGELRGSLYYADGTPGRVSYVDMAIKGRPGMIMDRATPRPPYRERVVITQDDIDYALQQVSLDGVITRDEEGNVIIVISATHRRIITPSGEITEVFEQPGEFTAFFFNYTGKYPRVVWATGSRGEKNAYVALPLKKGAFSRVYTRVIPYEEICVIESVNYPINGYAYHEVRATEAFMKKYPNATYLENVKDAARFPGITGVDVHPVENGYFSFMQGAGASDFNHQVNVYEEQVRAARSKQDVSQITAAEMEKIFDGSLLNAEIIVGKGDAVSTATYERIKTRE